MRYLNIGLGCVVGASSAIVLGGRRRPIYSRFPRIDAAVNCLWGRPTVFGVDLVRPPALVIRDSNGGLVSHNKIDGHWGSAVEVRP